MASGPSGPSGPSGAPSPSPNVTFVCSGRGAIQSSILLPYQTGCSCFDDRYFFHSECEVTFVELTDPFLQYICYALLACYGIVVLLALRGLCLSVGKSTQAKVSVSGTLLGGAGKCNFSHTSVSL